MRTFLFLALLLAPLHCRAQAADFSSTAKAFERALAETRADRKALSVRPSSGSAYLPAVEAMLEDPLDLPEALAGWDRSMGSARSLSDLAALAGEVAPAGSPAGKGLEPPKVKDVSGLPPQVETAVLDILRAMAEAKPLAERAASSLSPEERRLALETVQAMIFGEDAGRKEPEALRLAERFDGASMREAARLVAAAVDRALPVMRSGAGGVKPFSKKRTRQAFGDVLVSGPGDDRYSAEDLEGAALVLDFGGDNSYQGPTASAGAGEVRLVIDLGRNVSIGTPEEPVRAGAGIFGVGFLYLSEPAGAKAVFSADISLGAGLFGVGGVEARGAGSRLKGGRFNQGAGAFGAGLFFFEGERAELSADLAAQGFGYTRGAGLFLHRGKGSSLDCGLRYPDAREDLALLSLCQGVGQGPRAFAGGGVGLAYVDGGGSTLRSAYFAQGSGYWHGLGGLFLHGSGNRLLARRYSQGAGVHTAVGALTLEGDGNELRNWGVGPGFGWDLGTGLFLGRGDRNSLSADWASGRGDINGHGLLAFDGRQNRLALVDMGTGALRRGAPSYGLAVLNGEGSAYKPSEPSPWGRVLGTALADPGLSPAATGWPRVDRESAVQADRERNTRRLDAARDLPLDGRIEAWLSVLAGGGLDQATPMQSALDILYLDPEEGAAFVRFLDPVRFDELIWLRTLLPAFGGPVAEAAVRELGSGDDGRKAAMTLLLSSLGVGPSSEPVLRALASPDRRLRRAGALAAGVLLGGERGEEPGRLRLLEAALHAVTPSTRTAEAGLAEEAVERMGARRLSDLLGVLGLDPAAPAEDRVRVFTKCGNPFDRMGPGTEGVREFVSRLQSRPNNYGEALRRELSDAASFRPKARAGVLKLLSDPEPEVLQSALLALGQIGEPADAVWVARFLRSESSSLRETAAAALGKMGAAADAELAKALRSPEPGLRALAVLAAAQSGEAATLRFLKEGFKDPSPEVRRTAVAGLFAVQDPFKPGRSAYLEELGRLESSDPNPEVRADAARAARLLSP